MCRIYVGSLDYYLTELEIKSVFQAFGTVTSVDMPKEGDRSKGFCFVEYASPEAAQMALSTMHNFVLKGRLATQINTSTTDHDPPLLIPADAAALAAATEVADIEAALWWRKARDCLSLLGDR